MEGHPEALHRARVASRRLRELLPLLGQTSGKAAKRVRKLTRALGRVREMDVALSLLDTEELAGGVPRLSVFEARRHLAEGRDARREEMLRTLNKLSLKKLQRGLDRLAQDVAADGALAARQALAARLGRRAKALSEAMSEAGAIYVPERLHAVRIAAKKLRYALEIAAELGVKEAARLATRVRRAQVTLGHLQDRTVLLAEVQEAATRAEDPAARRGLQVVATRLEQAARRLHGEYLSHREDVMAALSAVRQDVVPELARLRRRTPLKAALRPPRAATLRGGRR
jgi:CHAD domain-containing protein